MQVVIIGLLLVLLQLGAAAQDSIPLNPLSNMNKQSVLLFPGEVTLVKPTVTNLLLTPSTVPLNFTAPCYAYNQGKLPFFCAFEDRIWRRTGLPVQFRIAERPIGTW